MSEVSALNGAEELLKTLSNRVMISGVWRLWATQAECCWCYYIGVISDIVVIRVYSTTGEKGDISTADTANTWQLNLD